MATTTPFPWGTGSLDFGASDPRNMAENLSPFVMNEESSFGPMDVLNAAGQGINVGTKETIKNFFSAAGAAAEGAHARMLADAMKVAETGMQASIEAGYGSPVNNAYTDFQQHPVTATAFNVAAGVPLLAGAVATRNPWAAAGLFAVPAYGTMYSQAKANGLDHSRAADLAMSNALINAAAIVIPVGRATKLLEQATARRAAGEAAKYVIGDSWKNIAKEAGVQGVMMAGISGGMLTTEGILRNVGWDDPNIFEGLGSAMVTGLVTGGILGATTRGVLETAKSKYVSEAVDIYKKTHPDVAMEMVAEHQQKAADVFDIMMKPLSERPKDFMQKYKDVIGFPETFVSLAGNKGAKPTVEFMMSGTDEQRSAARQLVKDKFLPKTESGAVDPDLPETYVAMLNRKAMNEAILGKNEEDIIKAVTEYKKELDSHNNLWVSGSGGEKVFDEATEVWHPIYGKQTVKDMAWMLKNPQDKPQGSVHPDEMQFFSRGMFNESGKFIESSSGVSKVKAILRRAWDMDKNHVAMKTNSDGTLNTFRMMDDGTVVVDAVSRAPEISDLTGWKQAIDGKDITEVFKTINSTRFGAIQEALSNFFERNGMKIQVLVHTAEPDIQSVFGKPNVSGRYDSDTKTIHLNFTKMGDTFSIKRAAAVVLHESVHAATVETVRNYIDRGGKGNSPEANAHCKEIVDLYNETLKRVMDKDADARTVLSRISEADRNKTEMNLSKDEKDMYYGFRNPYEFVAEGMSNEGFQKHLNNYLVKDGVTFLDKLKSLATKILRSIADTAGIAVKSNSVLKKLINDTTGLLTEETGKNIDSVSYENIWGPADPELRKLGEMSVSDILQRHSDEIRQQEIAGEVSDEQRRIAEQAYAKEKEMMRDASENSQLRWGSRLNSKDSPLPSQRAAQAANDEMARAISDARGDSDFVDGADIIQLSEAQQINRKQKLAINTFVQNVSQAYQDFQNNVYNLFTLTNPYRRAVPSEAWRDAYGSGTRGRAGYKSKIRSGYLDVEKQAALASGDSQSVVWKWFNDLINNVETSSLSKPDGLKALEYNNWKMRVDKLQNQVARVKDTAWKKHAGRLDAIKTELDMLRLQESTDEAKYQRLIKEQQFLESGGKQKVFIDSAQKAYDAALAKLNTLKPAFNEELVAQAIMVLESYRKEVSGHLAMVDVPTKFLYTIGVERLANQGEFMEIIGKISELKQERLMERGQESVKLETKLEQAAKLSGFSKEVRVDMPVVVDDRTVVDPGLYLLSRNDNGDFVLKSDSREYALEPWRMAIVAREASFKVADDLSVRVDDFYDPGYNQTATASDVPDIAGHPGPQYKINNVFDAIKMIANPIARQNFMAEVAGVSKQIKVVEGTVIDHMAATLYEHKQRQDILTRLAQSTIQPTSDLLKVIAKEFHSTGKFQGQALSKEGASKQVYTAMDELLKLAYEETWNGAYDHTGTAERFTTEKGLEYKFDLNVPEDRRSSSNFVNDYNKYATMFGLQPLPTTTLPDGSVVAASRPKRAFTELAGQIDQRLPGINVYLRALEYPIMMEGIRTGLFSNFDLASSVIDGYTRRVFWDPVKQEHTSGSYNITGGKSARPDKRRSDAWTLSDWYHKADTFSGLVADRSHLNTFKDYMTEYSGLIVQHQYLNMMRDFKTPDAEILTDSILAHLEAKKKEGLRAVTPARADLLAKVRMMSIIEYKDSDILNEIHEMTRIKGEVDTGLSPTNTLTGMGYEQVHDYPGFAKFKGRGFQPPFVAQPVHNLIRVIFEPRMGSSMAGWAKINNTVAGFKRWMSVIPTDSTFLFMSAVMANTNPVLWPTKVFFPYMKALASSGKTSVQDLARLMHMEGLESTKTWQPLQSDNMTQEQQYWYKLLRKNGAHFLTAADIIHNAYGKTDIATFDHTESLASQYGEYLTSSFGMNNLLFRDFIIPNLYEVAMRKAKALADKGVDHETAARVASEFVSTTSGVMSHALFGKEGDILNLVWFARGLTTGFIKTMTGAAYPVLRKMGVSKGMYKAHTGEVSRLMNPFVHGNVRAADMDLLAVEYQKHIGKVLGMSLFSYAALQYIMSFYDDDQMDEHGEIAKGNPFAKKRFMWLNEPLKRFSIRTTLKDETQRRVYITPQFLREGRQMVDMLGNFGSESVPEGTHKWFKNRLNAFWTITAGALYGVDIGLGEKIVKDSKLDPFKQGETYAAWFADQFAPFGLSSKDWQPVSPVNEQASKVLGAVRFFGVGTAKGMPMEEGVQYQKLDEAKRAVALRNYKNEQMRDELKGLSLEQKMTVIKEKFPNATPAQVRAIIFAATQPGQKAIRSAKRALWDMQNQ